MSRLTIEQAISHAREVAEKNKANCERNTIVIPNRWISDAQCAEEHEQLAEWLEELQRYKGLEDQGRLVEQRYATTCECCCSACKEDYTRVAEGESGMVWEGEYPNYCPWCGAKFVSNEELKEIEGME